MKIGQAKYERGSRNYFSFKKDQNVFTLRILPPLGSLADAGKWFCYHSVEYGHKGSDGRMKPFLSTRVVNRDKMVEQESECHLKRVKIEEALKNAEAKGDSAMIEQCKKMLGNFNLDKKYYMNTIDLHGNVGLFKIGYRGFKALESKIEELRKEGIDPLSIDNGRFFTFSRSGRGIDTVYSVSEYKEKRKMQTPEGEVLVDVPYKHVINDAVIAKLETDAFDLDKIYPTVTPEEEYRIVHEGPVAVDEILGKKSKAEPTKAPSQEAVEKAAPAQEDMAKAMGAPADAPTEPPQSSATTEEVVNTDTGEITEEPKKTANSVTSFSQDMSDEEFYNQIKNGNF